MDPRSSATAAELDEQLRLGLEIFGEVRRTRRAVAEIAAVKKHLEQVQQQLAGHKPELLKQVAELQAAITKIEKGSASANSWTDGTRGGKQWPGIGASRGGRWRPHHASQAIEVYKQSDEAAKARIAEWAKLKSTELPRLNNALQKAGVPPIQISQIEHEVEYLVSQ